MFFQLPRFLHKLFPDLIWKIDVQEKKIYLTFDDGPVPGVTSRVLDILDEYGWKATFFCVGENVKHNPELYLDILHRGHKTGNHTYNHLKGTSCASEVYCQNADLAARYIRSDLFRPPYGRFTLRQWKCLRDRYKIVMWDVLTFDYSRKQKPAQIIRTLQKRLKPGSIVVFHDSLKSRDNMLNSLPKALELWIQAGYSYGIL